MAETKKTAENKAVKEKTVHIRLPLTKKEKDDVFVGINGRRFQIQRGKDVEVPVSVYEVLQHQEEMLNIAMEYEAQMAAKAEQ